MPTATYSLAAATGANGLLYVFGGVNSSGSALNTVQAYNPSTNTWTTEASMPTASEYLAAAAGANGLLYVFGGFNSSYSIVNTVQAYNPATNTWNTAASMPTASASLAAAAGANGLIYVFGGFNNFNGKLISTRCRRTIRPPITVDYRSQRHAHRCTVSWPGGGRESANGLLYVFGGVNSNAN